MESANHQKATNKTLPSVNGWRAISICLVLGTHCVHLFNIDQYPRILGHLWIFGDKLGVRLFFVISGFLITYLLAREMERKQQVSLRNFYIRRALRILPVYLAFLLVVLCLQLFTNYHQTGAQWLSNLTFTTDFFPTTFTTDHLWSLSVEEQFYLGWPLIFLFCLRSHGLLALALALPLVVAPLCRVISCKYYYVKFPMIPEFLFGNYGHPFLLNFDALAIGCLAGVVMSVKYDAAAAAAKEHFFGLVLFGVSLFSVPLILPYIRHGGIIAVALGDQFQAFGFVVLLLLSIFRPEKFKPLNWKIVQQIGILSYSMYIWQQIFCSNPVAFGFARAPLMSFPYWFAPVFLVSAASYYLIEKPINNLRTAFK